MMGVEFLGAKSFEEYIYAKDAKSEGLKVQV